MMTRLMHNRTHLPRLIPLIIPHLPNPHSSILLQQRPSPPPGLADTFPPPRNLSLVVLAPPSPEEAAVPLEPASYVVVVVDPTRRLPRLDVLARGDLELVRFGVVGWADEIARDVESGGPGFGQFAPVFCYCDAETPRAVGSEVGAPEGALVQDFGGRFVGREEGVGGELEGLCYWVTSWRGRGRGPGTPACDQGGCVGWWCEGCGFGHCFILEEFGVGGSLVGSSDSAFDEIVSWLSLCFVFVVISTWCI